jgi:hypothetical protein
MVAAELYPERTFIAVQLENSVWRKEVFYMDNNGLKNVLANTGRHQHLLKLGHKLAAACDKVVEANPKNLSQKIEQMEDVLVHYRRIVAVINFEMDREGN